MRPAPLLLLLLLASAPAPGQADPVAVTAVPHGPAFAVDVVARDAPMLRVLSQVAAAVGREVNVAPEVLDLVLKERLTVSVKGVLLDHFVLDLAGALGLVGSVEDGALVVAPEPRARGPEHEGFLGRSAETACRRASLADPGAAGPAALQAALLELGAGAFDRALPRFRLFIESHPLHPEARRAQMLAGYCAFRAGDADEATRLLAAIEDELGEGKEPDESRLLLAGVYKARGEDALALVRYDRMIRTAARPESRALAALLKAELFYERGDGAAALSALRFFDQDLQRELPELAAHLPLFTGLCLSLTGQAARAIPHLQLAALLEEEAERRTRAANELVRCYLALEDPLTALLAVRTALKQAPAGPLRVDALRFQARIYADLGLTDLAITTHEEVVREARHEPKVVQEALEGTARLLFAERRFAEARELFLWLREHGAPSETRIMTARCEMGLGDHLAALRTLDAIDALTLAPEQRDEVTRLRADCYLARGEFAKASLAYRGWKEGNP